METHHRVPRTWRGLALIGVALGLVACDETLGEWTWTIENCGGACVVGGDTPAGTLVEPGQLLMVEVLSPCRPPNAIIEEMTCEATVTGGRIVVTSEITMSALRRDEPTLTRFNICTRQSATCPVGPLEPGTYVIEHGPERQVVEVPGVLHCSTR